MNMLRRAAPATGFRTDRRRSRALRFLPIGVIAVGAAGMILIGVDWLSFETLARHRDVIQEWRTENPVVTALIFMVSYVIVVALSVPGAIWFTITGGFLFGTVLGTALTLVSATTGACIIFLAARSSLGALLRRRAGDRLARIERGYHEGEASYLLVMRLVPVIPFFVANLAPAFLGTRLRTFAWTTFVGIAPGTVVHSSVGAGLGALLDRGEEPDLGVMLTPGVVVPLFGLACLAALPLVLRKIREARQ